MTDASQDESADDLQRGVREELLRDHQDADAQAGTSASHIIIEVRSCKLGHSTLGISLFCEKSEIPKIDLLISFFKMKN